MNRRWRIWDSIRSEFSAIADIVENKYGISLDDERIAGARTSGLQASHRLEDSEVATARNLVDNSTMSHRHDRIHHGHRQFSARRPGDQRRNRRLHRKGGTRVLRSEGPDSANCGIKSRHYAIDKNQQTVVSNAAMAAGAVRNAAERAGLGPNDVELLSAATTMPDVMGPGHASMVHGELGYGPLEITARHLQFGMMALKNAYLQVAIGEKRNAISVASEFASRVQAPATTRCGRSPKTGRCRWKPRSCATCSPMARAPWWSRAPATSGISLRIDWISLTSYANTEKACMFFGSNDNACAKTWGDYPTASAAAADGALAPRQKLSLLPHLVRVGIDEYERLLAMGKFDPTTVTWFPVHYSSERMKTMVLGRAVQASASGRPEMWYSNLTRVGNIGSAAIFVILDEMMTEGLIKDGDTLLCMVPVRPVRGSRSCTSPRCRRRGAGTPTMTPASEALAEQRHQGGGLPLPADRPTARGRRCIDRSARRQRVGHPPGGVQRVAFPFPWPIRRFFGVFPAAVDSEALVELVEPAGGFDTDQRGMVILAYQVWYLAPRFPSGRC